MIYWFSGTGNSRYVARELGRRLEIDIAAITEADPTKATDADGFVFPVHSWGVPKIVLQFISRMPEQPGRPVWMVCTCGDETGLTPDMFAEAVARRGMHLTLAASVIMPNTYVTFPGFDVDSAEVEQKKIREAPACIDRIARSIAEGSADNTCLIGSMPRLKTKAIYPWFNRYAIDPRKFRAGDGCIGCGRCASVCPTGNITMTDGRPQWGMNCTLCLACYHCCKPHAVIHGRWTRGKGQYTRLLNQK